MAYLILPASIIAFSAYVWLIARDPATRVASYAYVNPVVALLLGALLAHERPTALQYAGAALVLAGVVATLAGRRVALREPAERAV
jgi:drug/metabolite transporter (DMT)-like permease